MVKKNFDITRQYRDDLMQAYREVSAECWSQEEAWRKTAKHPAPRYYVTPGEAYDRMRRMVVGDTSQVDALSDCRRRMYYSMFEKLEEMTQRKETVGKSLWAICQTLVLQPAPEFFVTPRTVRHIYSNYKKYGSDFRHNDVYGKKKLEE